MSDVFPTDDTEPTLWERIVWRLRVWHYFANGWAHYWLAVAWWTWKTRKLPKTRITLVHAIDVTFFWPGQVVGGSYSDGGPVVITSRVVRMDRKRGVLICAKEAAA